MITTGKEDQLMNIDCDLWATCMLEHSKTPPPLCPSHLAEDLEYFMHTELGITLADITHDNCKSVYVDLASFIESIV